MLEVQITPDEAAYDDDEFDGDDEGENYLYQSGYDTETIEVALGEKFTIEPDYTGSIDCSGTSYVLRYKKSRDHFEDDNDELDEEPVSITLKPGRYLFHKDGITIERL